jgi:uncharacterized protein DUF4345
VSGKHARFAIGLVIAAFGTYLALQPLVVADALDKPHGLSTQMINLRASYGGTLMGIGAFVAWIDGLRPWYRVVVGLLGWAMAGIGIARLIGFALDGEPDGRQFVWITAEVVIAAACAYGVRRMKKR